MTYYRAHAKLVETFTEHIISDVFTIIIFSSFSRRDRGLFYIVFFFFYLSPSSPLLHTIANRHAAAVRGHDDAAAVYVHAVTADLERLVDLSQDDNIIIAMIDTVKRVRASQSVILYVSF